MRQRVSQAVSIHIKEHGSLYLFTLILLVMGIIFGAIIVNSLNFNQKQDLYFYLNRFFGQVSEGQLTNANELFIQGFVHYSKYLGLIWLLGLSVIGLPVILILLFLKGVVIGFTVGFLVNQMGWYGFLLSFASVIPQNLILIPAFLMISTTAVSFSLKLIKQQTGKRMHLPLFPFFIRYFSFMIATLICIGIASTLEAYVSPYLMKIIINWVGFEK